MKNNRRHSWGLLISLLLMPTLAAAEEHKPKAGGVIEGFGQMHDVPNAAYLPDAKKTYRVVFSVTRASEKPGQVNPSLDRVARTVNLYTSAGVPLNHLKFVAVLYGPATDAVLNQEHYRKQFGLDNPNVELIESLRRAGVDVVVCGQAIAEHGYGYDWITPKVTLALSALTTITALQAEGYALMPL